MYNKYRIEDWENMVDKLKAGNGSEKDVDNARKDLEDAKEELQELEENVDRRSRASVARGMMLVVKAPRGGMELVLRVEMRGDRTHHAHNPLTGEFEM